METVWTFRIMLLMAIAILIFGDYLQYGSVKVNKQLARQNNLLKEKQQKINLNDESTLDELQPVIEGKYKNVKKTKIAFSRLEAFTFTEECLPKMLCQMASKPAVMLNDRERSLLSMIKTTTMSLAWYSSPTKWHFAAHMGQLMRSSADALTGAMGCAELWPQCPINSQQLLRLSSKLLLK